MACFFPDIALLNQYYIGDSVLLEAPARLLSELLGVNVSIISNYPELFIGHPSIRGILPGTELSQETRVIDMGDAIRSLEDKPNGRVQIIEGKIRRLYEAAGLTDTDIIAPRLYLTPEEQLQAKELSKLLPENRIGVALESRHRFKDVPHIEFVVKKLVRSGYTVFLIGKDVKGDYHSLEKLPTIKIFDKPLREAMIYISLMDQFIGPDTGLVHIAGALKVPFTVITREIWRDLYDCYDVGKILAAKSFGKNSLYTLSVRPRQILRTVKAQKEVKPKPSKRGAVALFRLDGLGGTLTLADQAKKIYQQTGMKSDLIIRGYGDVFRDNPYVNKVIETGRMVQWHECLSEMLEQYDTLAEIRFAPGKWYQKGEKIFHQDFESIRELFDAFPMRLTEWELHGLHQVQLTDKTLGLPYDTIDMEIFNYGNLPKGLPEEYVVFNNGVDVQHNGMLQTKTWPFWDELCRLVDVPIVQVGTYHDATISGTIDLRGKTTIPEMFTTLREAQAVVCTEGGTMHSAYASGNKKTIVIRGPVSGKLFHYPGQNVVDSYVCAPCVGSTGDWYSRCPKDIDAACMKTISAERVAFNLEEVLNGTPFD